VSSPQPLLMGLKAVEVTSCVTGSGWTHPRLVFPQPLLMGVYLNCYLLFLNTPQLIVHVRV
jgi:hypothetical protein